MRCDRKILRLFIAACAIGIGARSETARADKEVLEYYVGHWDIHAETLQPEPSRTSYTERYEWTLDGRFIQGKTGRKADGAYDVIYGTYDAKADGYPFWIFSSSGSYTYLPPAKWNARERTMEWENPENWDVVYKSRCHFPDRDSRHCSLNMKDWKGKVLLDLKWRATRRDD
jgi:hypothetical protein